MNLPSGSKPRFNQHTQQKLTPPRIASVSQESPLSVAASPATDPAGPGGRRAPRGSPSSHRRRSRTPGTPFSGRLDFRLSRATSPRRCAPARFAPHRSRRHSRRIRSARQVRQPDPIRTASPGGRLRAPARSVHATPVLPRASSALPNCSPVCAPLMAQAHWAPLLFHCSPRVPLAHCWLELHHWHCSLYAQYRSHRSIFASMRVVWPYCRRWYASEANSTHEMPEAAPPAASML